MPKRTDQNQSEIVTALRQAGASVQPLHTVGRGCPDVLVGFRGANYLIEIKNPAQKPSVRRLTPAEQQWHASWRGQRTVIETPEQALAAIGLCTKQNESEGYLWAKNCRDESQIFESNICEGGTHEKEEPMKAKPNRKKIFGSPDRQRKQARLNRASRTLDEGLAAQILNIIAARAERIANGETLCTHAVDVRKYQSVDEQQHDDTQPAVCAECDKPQMRVSLTRIPSPDAAGKFDLQIFW